VRLRDRNLINLWMPLPRAGSRSPILAMRIFHNTLWQAF
jgi:hypothetical protein